MILIKDKNESVQQRQEILSKLRQYKAEKMKNESEEQKQERLSKLRQYAADKRKNESAQQRQERLSKDNIRHTGGLDSNLMILY